MKILRWVAVLPAAIIGSLIVYMIAKFIGRWFSPVDGVGIIGLIFEIGYSFILGAMFVIVGSLVAPEYRKTTSVVLATLGVVIGIAAICTQIFYLGSFDWFVILGSAATAAGCIGGAVNIHDTENTLNNK
jgi:hypothetical protein